mmetsp:Transcript_53572/g.162722  ORF Transcript_53572/g.162722 Transcript_53572/m.162722 type:complete len:211 (+) Transcript_53572:261-893(+)
MPSPGPVESAARCSNKNAKKKMRRHLTVRCDVPCGLTKPLVANERRLPVCNQITQCGLALHSACEVRLGTTRRPAKSATRSGPNLRRSLVEAADDQARGGDTLRTHLLAFEEAPRRRQVVVGADRPLRCDQSRALPPRYRLRTLPVQLCDVLLFTVRPVSASGLPRRDAFHCVDDANLLCPLGNALRLLAHAEARSRHRHARAPWDTGLL